MARINIEECWWSDPRRERLGQLLGNPLYTETVAVRAWRLAQRYWEQNKLITGHVFVTLFGFKELLQSNLAVLYENNSLDTSSISPAKLQQITSEVQHVDLLVQRSFVYVRGSQKYLSWGADLRQKRMEAGRKSAERPRDSRGRLLPKSTKTQQITSTSPARSNEDQHSGSGSGSVSGSCSVTTKTNTKEMGLPAERPKPAKLFDFEAIYELYPKRRGNQRRADGLKMASNKFRTQEDYDRFKRAVLNYTKHCQSQQVVGTEFVSQFKTFVSSLWEEWVDPAPITATANLDWTRVFSE